MAIVKMRKVSILGLERERQRLIDTLSSLGCLEIIEIENIESTHRHVDETHREELSGKMAALQECLETLEYFQIERFNMLRTRKKRQRIPLPKDSKAKKIVGGRKIEVGMEDFLSAHSREYNIFSKVVDHSKKIKARIAEIDSLTDKHETLCADLLPYTVVDVQLNRISDTANTAILLGKVENIDAAAFEKMKSVIGEAMLTITRYSKSEQILLAVCMQGDRRIVEEKLAGWNFAACPHSFPVTAKQKRLELKEELTKLYEERLNLLEEGTDLADFADEVKLLYDYLSVEYQKESVNEHICKTNTTFMMEAWLPHDKEVLVQCEVKEALTSSVVMFSDPTEDENPPTITKNNSFVEPFTTITNMYDVPNYHERDPNPLMSIFYLIFFGMLMGDVGYGLIIIAATTFMLRFMKPEGEFKRLLQLFRFGGISSIIWGVLMGSWFAIESDSPLIQPVLFNPIENTMEMIGLSLAFGVAHIAAGYAMRAYNKITKGQILDAVLDDFTWISVFAGIALVAASILWPNQTMQTAGIIVIAAAFAVLLATGGRKNKSIIAKVLGGTKNLYSVITLFSDILSYIRLFALGLASAILGQVFNSLAGMVGGAGSVIILVIAHTLNIAIGLLGIYVHNTRLQFIEFFSKFYKGEGHSFKPLAGETQYIKIVKRNEIIKNDNK